MTWCRTTMIAVGLTEDRLLRFWMIFSNNDGMFRSLFDDRRDRSKQMHLIKWDPLAQCDTFDLRDRIGWSASKKTRSWSSFGESSCISSEMLVVTIQWVVVHLDRDARGHYTVNRGASPKRRSYSPFSELWCISREMFVIVSLRILRMKSEDDSPANEMKSKRIAAKWQTEAKIYRDDIISRSVPITSLIVAVVAINRNISVSGINNNRRIESIINDITHYQWLVASSLVSARQNKTYRRNKCKRNGTIR